MTDEQIEKDRLSLLLRAMARKLVAYRRWADGDVPTVHKLRAEVDRLNLEIQGYQTSDGYDKGWEHGAATAAELKKKLAAAVEQGEGWSQQWLATRQTVAERDARITTINETLAAARLMMATDSRDWSQDRSDVWLYGLIVGWECEEDHEHDDVMCGGDSGLREVAAQHGWGADDLARIRSFRAALQGGQPDDLVAFLAPVDWRDQLDGADPIHVFETWIVNAPTEPAPNLDCADDVPSPVGTSPHASPLPASGEANGEAGRKVWPWPS